MTDVETTFRTELNRLLVVDATPDWEGIVEAAGVRGEGRRQRRQRLAVAAAALLGAAAVALVTPLGGAIARGLDEFTTWLTGEPGQPVSAEEQRAFEEENQRKWLGFPEGAQLRRLLTRTVDGHTVVLFGFRSGSRLCLRLEVSGETKRKTLECAPLDELRREGGPARVLIADEGVGSSDKVAWYGIDRVVVNKLRITAGVAADGVDAVLLRDDSRRHEVPVESNAFLYVAVDPEVEQLVQEVAARIGGQLVPVPFAPAPYSFAPGRTPAPAPPAPPVERQVTGGRIGWLDDREERGEPLDALPKGSLSPVSRQRERGEVVFGRVLTPDPGQPSDSS